MLVKTDYAETPWIKPGKVYELKLCKGEEGKPNPLYIGQSELNAPFLTRLTRSQHIGNQDWEIVE